MLSTIRSRLQPWISAFALCASTAAFWWIQRYRQLKAVKLKPVLCTDPEVLSAVKAVQDKYDLSEDGGFLPSYCLERLPAAFDAIEALAANLPQLNRDCQLRHAVDALPSFDVTSLAAATPEELRRAYVLLGELAHSYVHGQSVPWHLLGGSSYAGDTSPPASKEVPPQISVPWLEVCRQLQMPAVLTAGATDLWNWRRADPERGMELGNLLQSIEATGTRTERTFHMVPCAMQAAAAKVAPKIFLADVLVRGKCEAQLAALLREVSEVLKRFKELFGQLPAGVDVDTFYDVYRPLLDGFYPDGCVLVGAPEYKSLLERIPFLTLEGDRLLNKSKGPSAGQSTIILLFDLLLGVSHAGSGASFQEEMLLYMPAKHRQMVLDYRLRWKDIHSLPEFVKKSQAAGSADAADLAEAFEECVTSLRNLRRFHLATVSRYLTRTSTGTGASTWRRLLQEMLDSTSETRVCCG